MIQAAEPIPVPDGYRLVWHDEFDQDGPPDPKSWTFEEGFVRNHEDQWYQADNAVCQDGLLIIEGRQERRPNPAFDPNSTNWKNQRRSIEYTSACVKTKGLRAWRYGRFEVRAKAPVGSGMWPAIWFIGESGEWPSCGEIDLFEYYRGHILANTCWGTTTRWKPKWDAVKKPLADFGGPAWADDFHIWTMDWDQDRIVLALDGQVLNTTPLTETANPKGHEPANPFHQPHHLLLNLALGGDNGGDLAGATFPKRFLIDYVRVFQRDGEAAE